MENQSVYLEILKHKTEPILYEEEDWFILAAKNPCNDGHIIIIPKLKVAEFYDLPPNILHRGIDIATTLSKALKSTYESPRTALFIKGFAISNHAHIHVTPIFKSTDMDKDQVRKVLSLAEIEILATKLIPLFQNVLD